MVIGNGKLKEKTKTEMVKWDPDKNKKDEKMKQIQGRKMNVERIQTLYEEAEVYWDMALNLQLCLHPSRNKKLAHYEHAGIDNR